MNDPRYGPQEKQAESCDQPSPRRLSAGICNSMAEPPEQEAARWTRLHAPRDPVDGTKMDALRPAASAFIQTILTLCPSNADRTAAVRYARLALMQAVASIVVPQ